MTEANIRVLSIGWSANRGRLDAFPVDAFRVGQMSIEFVHRHKTADLTGIAMDEFDAICLWLEDQGGIQTQLKKLQDITSAAIIVLADEEDHACRSHALKSGAQAYVSAVEFDELPTTIRDAIDRQHHLDRKRDELAKLEQARQTLQELRDTTQRIFENVSHEVRTPLGVICEYASLLEDELVGPVNDEQRQILQTIETRADDLHRMVNNMLDMSRLGSVGICRRSVHPQLVVDYVSELLERRASCHGVSISYEVAKSLPPLYGDEDKLRGVLVNLVTNAIKYSRRPGQVQVRVEQSENGHELILAVIDNGPGIERDNLKRIFRRFDRLESNAHTAGGFGLGLDIAQELVDLHFGRLEVESVVGQGTTFRVHLPIDHPIIVAGQFLHYLERHAQSPGVGIYRVNLIASNHYLSQPGAADELDEAFQGVLGKCELAFRQTAGTWIVLAGGGQGDKSLRKRIADSSTGDDATIPPFKITCLDSPGTEAAKLLTALRQYVAVPGPKSRPILRKAASRRQVRDAQSFDGQLRSGGPPDPRMNSATTATAAVTHNRTKLSSKTHDQQEIDFDR